VQIALLEAQIGQRRQLMRTRRGSQDAVWDIVFGVI
jgi:hypothetical protein